MQSRRNKAFTLLEILIATGIMVLMVTFMIVLVRSAMSSWSISEERTELFAQARRLLDLFQQDLRSTAYPQEATNGEIRFIADHDGNSRVRLRLVRSIRGESSWWVTREAGRQLLADKYIDQDNDIKEADRGLLRPPGGLMEVAYFFDTNPDSHRLWRAFRAPIGGPDSLFDNDKLYAAKGRPIADNVLYLEYRFWTPWTRSWTIPLGDSSTRARKASPLTFWDSTRRTLPQEAYSIEGFFPLLQPSLPSVQSTPLLPSQILVTIVLKLPRRPLDEIVLMEDTSSDGTTLTLNSTAKLPRGKLDFKYILIDREWIRYESVSGNKVVLGGSGTRGARRTIGVEHKAGTPVYVGKTFRWVIELPTRTSNYRETSPPPR